MGLTRLTDETFDACLEAARAGLSLKRTAQYVGVGERTIKDWLARGRSAIEASEETGAPILEEEVRFASFAKDWEQAQSSAVARNLTLIQQAATADWRAAAWYLERSHPDEFGRSNRVEVSGPVGGPMELHSEHVVVGQIDVAVALDVLSDPERVSAITRAMHEAGIETTVTGELDAGDAP